jgi:hypothetical protein
MIFWIAQIVSKKKLLEENVFQNPFSRAIYFIVWQNCHQYRATDRALRRNEHYKQGNAQYILLHCVVNSK